MGVQIKPAPDVTRKKYRRLSGAEADQVQAIKQAGDHFLQLLAGMDSRATSIARTKIEEAVMWAVKHVTA
jgi:hypothetical protein